MGAAAVIGSNYWDVVEEDEEVSSSGNDITLFHRIKILCLELAKDVGIDDVSEEFMMAEDVVLCVEIDVAVPDERQLLVVNTSICMEESQLMIGGNLQSLFFKNLT